MGRGRPKKFVTKEENKEAIEQVVVNEEEQEQNNVESHSCEAIPVETIEVKEEKPSVILKKTTTNVVAQNYQLGLTKIIPKDSVVELVTVNGNGSKIKYHNIEYYVGSMYLV